MCFDHARAAGKHGVVCVHGAGTRGVHDPRFLSDGERGTGIEGGQGEFSTGGPRDRRAGPVALSSLFLSISVLRRGDLARHRAGLPTAIRMRLFWGLASHFVSFCLIRLYLCLSRSEGRLSRGLKFNRKLH